MSGLRSDGSRTALIVASLLAALAATAVLAWQAQRAVSYHRRAAANVLRDYASLAADEFIRQSTSKLGYEAYYPLATALSQAIESETSLEQTVETLRSSSDEKLEAARSLPDAFFYLHGSTLELVLSRAEPPSTKWMSAVLSSLTPERPFTVVHTLDRGNPRTLVAMPHPRGDGVVGFTVNLETLGMFLAPVMESSLLPDSLGQGGVTNKPLFVRVIDHGDVERFRSEGQPHYELNVSRAFGDRYQGVLDGFHVELSIDPVAANDLVIGGLPPSRLPLLAGLFVLTGGLLAVAILQLRKERRLQNLRTEFVSSVSHELRTPLAQIRMYADTLLLGRVRSSVERKRSLEIVAREATRLSHMVDNLLEFSRADPGKREVSTGSIALATIATEVVERFTPLMREHNGRVITQLSPDVRASIEPNSFQQILLNLLDNAVKYGPPGQKILLSISADELDDNRIRVSVEDEGPGIPVEDRERIFERFFRLERDRKSSVTGTGVGLAVVRDLATRSGGRVFIEGTERGGSRWVVELPSSPEGFAP